MKTYFSFTNEIFLKSLKANCEMVKGFEFKGLCIHDAGHVWEYNVDINVADDGRSVEYLRQVLSENKPELVEQIVLRGRYADNISIAKYLALHWSEICFDISSISLSSLGILATRASVVEGNAISIKVHGNLAVQKLNEREIDKIIANNITKALGQAVTVKFLVGDFSDQIQKNQEKAAENARQKQIEKETKASKEVNKVIYKGRKCNLEEPIMMEDLYANLQVPRKATLKGRVLSYAPAKRGYHPIERFAITDYSSSVDCFVMLPNVETVEKIAHLNLQEDSWVKVAGVLDYNREEELQFRADYIEQAYVEVEKEDYDEHRIELHAHTQMSKMDGLTNINKLIQRAADWKHPALGITDHGNVHIYPELYSAAKKAGIKPLFGVEAYLMGLPKSDVAAKVAQKNKKGPRATPEEKAIFKANRHHIVLYAKNLVGLRNIYDLVSISNTEYFYAHPLVPREVLMEYRQGLIIGSACEQGEIFKLVMKEYLQQISPADFNSQLDQIIGLYDYLEIQPLSNNRFHIAKENLKSDDDLIAINKRIYALGKQYHKPVVATCDVHVLDKHETIMRTVLQAGQGYNVQDAEETPLHFRSTQEMLAEFSYFGAEIAREVVIINPALVAAEIEDIAPIPDGFHPPTLAGAEAELRGLCMATIAKLYGPHPHYIVVHRYEREINDIVGNKFADLYMLAQKIVKKSLNDGYIVGSRGSVGSSFVAFLSGITEVNSLAAHYVCPKCFWTQFINYDNEGKGTSAAYQGITNEVGIDLPRHKCPQCGQDLNRFGFDIPFETFVGFNGDKTPDIDLNFASEYQPNAHRYIEELFGTENVFRAGTIGTLQDKTAYGFVKKYVEANGLEWPKAEINRISKGLNGIKRTTGQHPGGMIILPAEKNITEFCPFQYPANNFNAPNKTTHFDYHAMEDQLLKLDILGHDDPTQIRMLSDYIGYDVTTVPLDDKEMLSLFSGVKTLKVSAKAIHSKVGTLAIPEFGTEFVRGMLVETQPANFADLIRISGLSHGTDVWLNNASDLIKAKVIDLNKAICTRDDIMHDLIVKGVEPFKAFKIMEKVRKGKGLAPEDEEVMRDNNVEEWYIESCKKIGYMFPKAHAVAYVLNAARIAYCKVHHPLAFYASYFTVQRGKINAMIIANGKKAVAAAVKEIASKGRRNMTANEAAILTVLYVAQEFVERGFVMMPIDIYKSDSRRCQIVDGKIVPPFTAFPGLGELVAETIIEARKEGVFSSRENFQIRTSCNRTLVEKMYTSGIFGDLPESDQMGLFDAFKTPTPPPASSPTNDLEKIVTNQSEQFPIDTLVSDALDNSKEDFLNDGLEEYVVDPLASLDEQESVPEDRAQEDGDVDALQDNQREEEVTIQEGATEAEAPAENEWQGRLF